jgi:hypothetical protein
MDSGGDLFKPAHFVAAKNTSVPDDISAITMPLVQKYPKIRANALMSHSLLTHEGICVGNKGVCLNYNLLGLCSDPKCNYRHARAKPTPDRIKSGVNILRPAAQSYLTSGGQADKKRKHPPLLTAEVSTCAPAGKIPGNTW